MAVHPRRRDNTAGCRRCLWLAAAFAALVPAGAHAQNLIVNPGFENNPPANFGNNIGHPITPWILGAGNNSNVVKVDGTGGYDYGNGGPESDANPATGAGVQQHYLDIASGANDFYQAFTVPLCGSAAGQTRQATFSGAFSTRDNLSGSGAVRIRSGTGIAGAILAQATAALPAPPSSKTAPWVTVSGSVNVPAGSTLSYVVSMDNNLNFDQAALAFTTSPCASAPLTLRKTWTNAVINDRATITATRGGSVIDTLASVANTANETDTDATPPTVFQGEAITLAEVLPGTNGGTYAATLACTGGGTLSGSTLTVGTDGTPIVCTYTNAGPVVGDLVITKTNTPASGAADLAADTVVSGATTTYQVVVTNAGPATLTGAVVRDTPGTGIACPAANPVTCTSTASPSACPTGALTVAGLQAGLTLGTLPATVGSNTATLVFNCTVQ